MDGDWIGVGWQHLFVSGIVAIVRKHNDYYSQVFGRGDTCKVQLETRESAKIEAQGSRHAGESNAVSDVRGGNGAETGVQYPYSLADALRGTLIVVIRSDGKVCLPSRTEQAAMRQLGVMDILCRRAIQMFNIGSRSEVVEGELCRSVERNPYKGDDCCAQDVL